MTYIELYMTFTKICSQMHLGPVLKIFNKSFIVIAVHTAKLWQKHIFTSTNLITYIDPYIHDLFRLAFSQLIACFFVCVCSLFFVFWCWVLLDFAPYKISLFNYYYYDLQPLTIFISKRCLGPVLLQQKFHCNHPL